MSYLDKSLKEIHEALKSGEVTSKELVEESLKRAHSNQEELNSFVTICDDAKELEVTDNVLSGIPYAAKDNLSTKGPPGYSSPQTLATLSYASPIASSRVHPNISN